MGIIFNNNEHAPVQVMLIIHFLLVRSVFFLLFVVLN